MMVHRCNRDELPCVRGQRQWLHRHRRAKRSYYMFKVRRGDLIQGKEQQLHFAGAP